MLSKSWSECGSIRFSLIIFHAFYFISSCFRCVFVDSAVILNDGKRTSYFWHITDFHLDLTYEPPDKLHCYKQRDKNQTTFGDYGCDSSSTLVESALRFMRNKQGDNVEYVIWSGDSIANSNLKTIEAIAKSTGLFKQYFSTFSVIPVLGHTDNPNSNSEIHKYITNLWKLWLPSEALETFSLGGFYSIVQRDRPTIIVLNTNTLTGDKDPFGQWQWLEKILQDVRLKHNTAYIFGHMPPGFVEPTKEFLPKCLMSDYNNVKYLKMIEENADIIAGQFFGHLHADTFRIFYNASGSPISYAFVTPTLSPREYNNPAIRLYKFNEYSGKIYNYEQFYLVLNVANGKKSDEWVKEYDLLSYYRMNDITPNTLHKLAESLTQRNGTTFFEKYLDLYSVKNIKQDCTVDTSWYHYCAITRLDKKKFHQCLVESNRSSIECPQSHTIVIPQPSREFQSSNNSSLKFSEHILISTFVFLSLYVQVLIT